MNIEQHMQEVKNLNDFAQEISKSTLSKVLFSLQVERHTHSFPDIWLENTTGFILKKAKKLYTPVNFAQQVEDWLRKNTYGRDEEFIRRAINRAVA